HDRKWSGWDLNWDAVSASVCHYPEEQFIAVSPNGLVRVIGGGKVIDESPIEAGAFSPRTRGPLRAVRGIQQGRAYAVGTCRQAYRRDGPNLWKCIDETAQVPGTNLTETSFESIDGFAETEIYAVGWEGEIWYYNGQVWKKI